MMGTLVLMNKNVLEDENIVTSDVIVKSFKGSEKKPRILV